MMSRQARFDRREWLWIAIGAAVGFAYFYYNATLPGLLRGLLCCDSWTYINMSSGIHSWRQFFNDYATFTVPQAYDLNRVRGYPFFLFLHRWLLGLLKLTPPMDWMLVSFFTCFLLHCLSVIYLYRSLNRIGTRIHPVALALVLASPGLASYAALPVTDSFSTACVTFGLGGVARRRPFFAGLMFGLGVLCRPSLQVASVILVVAWGLFEIVFRRASGEKRLKSWLIGPLALLGYAVALSPQYSACTRAFGKLCYLKPGYVESQIPVTIQSSWGNAMYYTLTGSKKNPGVQALTIPDGFLQEMFSDCTPGTQYTLRDELGCLARHWVKAPVFFGKRIIGLFDNFHLNGYATWVTSLQVRIWSRIFGTAGFLGFLCLMWLFVTGVIRRKPDRRLLLGLFAIVYIGMSTLASVETRYAFPALAISCYAFVYVVQRLWQGEFPRRRLAIWGLVLAAVVFNVQAIAWDYADPGVYENIQDYLSP